MTTEKRTRVVLEAQAKGFEKAAAAAQKVQQAIKPPKEAAKQFSELDKIVEKSAQRLADLTRRAKDLKVALADKSNVKAFTALKDEAHAVNKELDILIGKRKSLSFTRGFMQGVTGGEYFPDKDRRGMIQQAAGRFVGGGIRSANEVRKGVMSMPYSGAQGLSSAAGAIPYIGPLVQGALQSAMGASSGALSVLQGRQSLMPLMGMGVGTNLNQQAAQARARAERGVAVPGIDQGAADKARGQAFMSSMANWRPGASASSVSGVGRTGQPVFGTRSGTTGASAGSAIDQALLAGGEANAANLAAQEAARKKALDKRAGAGNAAARKAMGHPFAGIRSAGQELMGVSEQQALQFAGGLFGSAGSNTGNAFMRQAMGANTAYGVSAEASGAFARAGRTGAMGAGGGGAGGLQAAIQDGMRLGLQGSDLSKYMERMAQGIEQFESTGIPVARESLASLQGSVAGNLGGNRAVNVGAQLTARMQGISQNGPSSGADMAMLQTMGGFNGGGLDDYFDAALKMQQGGGKDAGDNFQKMLGKAQSGYQTDKGKAIGIQRMFQGLGSSIGLDEALGIAQGGNSDKFRDQLLSGKAQAAALGQTGLEGAAKGVVNPALSRQAGTENFQNQAGEKMLKTVQDLEKTSANMAMNVANFNGELSKLSGWALEKSGKISEMIDNFHKSALEMVERLHLSK